MQTILATFGIDWRLLLINAVNFGLLMVALWYFLYEPVMRMLEERRHKVQKGVEDAQAAHQRLAEIEADRQGVLAAAGKEADRMVDEARAAATEKEREILGRGEAAAQAALKEAEAQAAALRQKVLDESRQEVAKLIVLGIEKSFK